MMPGHWHASLARRRHPQAILATGLITRSRHGILGQWVAFDAGVTNRLQQAVLFGARLRDLPPAEKAPPAGVSCLRLCPPSRESNCSNQRRKQPG
jgi:hypothetical protein